jgi:hypothetical protein
MKRHIGIFILLVILLVVMLPGRADANRSSRSASLSQAGVPSVVSYQGQVIVDGQPYTGNGYFKFAVVDEVGNTSYWSNDGSSVGGGEPSSAVLVSVVNGLFNVLLGDTTQAGMTQPLVASVFSEADSYLRVWFSSDNTSYSQLSPDRRIAAVPYALQAEQAINTDLLDGLHAQDFWGLFGNSGTISDTHFIGTTDSQPLVFKTNNVEQLRLDTEGNLGIGTVDPKERLTLLGNAQILGDSIPVARGYTSTYLLQPIYVFVSGRYAYVSSWQNDRLAIFDISDPDNIVARGYTSTFLDLPRSIFVSGRYAYVTSGGNNNFVVFDVSNPDNIIAMGSTNTNLNLPLDAYVSGNFAYVLSYNNDRLAIFDITDPTNSIPKGYTSINLDGPRSVYVSGRYAYVASYLNDRLAIFDISDPDNIIPISSTDVNLSGSWFVYVSDGYAYVASKDNDTLSIFDVSNPVNIIPMGYTTTNLDGPRSIYVYKNYAYVASEFNHRLAVFDVTDPTNIVAKGYTSEGLQDVWFVYISGHFAYVTSGSLNRLSIFELNFLESPTLDTGILKAGTLDVIDNASIGNNLYVQGGLNVGPGGMLVGGNLGVYGNLQITGNYIQLPTITGMAPPGADCDETSEAGRMVVRTDGTINLYICTGIGGWVGK